ncbi:MAG TPA: MmgE/PrpD family protein [Bryobacteraceae bacterium]|nr:MmgE/PrpD family protein [Bryobacteraceae bacterium]
MTRRGFLRGAIVATGLRQLWAEPNPPAALGMARVLNSATFSALPPLTVKYAKVLLASTLASAAAGTHIGSAGIVRELAKEQGGKPESSIWFDGTRVPAPQAARVNAMLSDAAASDDSDLRNVAHTGTCLTAVGLALGERMQASGQDLLCAMVTGYEAAGRMAEAIQPPSEALSGSWGHGFHASIIVAFGGVACAAKLLRLTDSQMANAIGLTATTMGGLAIGTNSWAREYHAGNAALCAVNAALAAGRGYTVNPDMLEAPRGFLATFGGIRPNTASLTRDLTGDFQIARFLAIKLVPGAHALQPAVEAAVNAAREANVPPEQISRILVSGPQIRSIGGNRVPANLAEAIHSLPYFLASAAADRDFSWVHTTPEKINRPVIARLIRLVEIDPSPKPVHYDWSWGATVSVVTSSGAAYTSTVDAPNGSAPRGIEWSAVDAKYKALMPQSGLSPARIARILDAIHNFERVKQISQFTRLLA